MIILPTDIFHSRIWGILTFQLFISEKIRIYKWARDISLVAGNTLGKDPVKEDPGIVDCYHHIPRT